MEGVRLGSKCDDLAMSNVLRLKFTGENWQLFGPIIDGHAEEGFCGDGGTRAPLSRYRRTSAMNPMHRARLVRSHLRRLPSPGVPFLPPPHSPLYLLSR